ncbi:transposase domain protein [Bacteroides fragilis str. 3988 T1]|nr:transposase domain protein [Bacteroides fragilis str. 3988 T1]EXY77385.1 transposase domain protein [Bacteroides fragilis str. 3988 T1]EXY77701.1 transposase domain protein [Bacteroides fragilis str. 3988 T1]EXY77821.1 transposase domain protein [Bacteroides fragilis str. 3988 T1]EXY77909.1 transposase domain protein [Bacteroides fragilis str. 3988 T1]
MFIWFQERKFAENKNFIMNKLSRYRKLRYNQLFESENRELRLNEMGNPLEVLSQYVDFEIFRPTLNHPFLPESAKVMPVVRR